MANNLKSQNLYHRLKSFFPVQLLLLHMRRSMLLLAFWLFIFALSGGWLFKDIGIVHLFRTPEYLGEVSPVSYMIVGGILGMFVMSYHISSYIFYSYRYPFLATLSRPLYTFSINNSIIPVFFYMFYSVVIIDAQVEEGHGFLRTLLALGSLYFGSILSISLVLSYFFSTIKSLPLKTLQKGIERPLKAIFRTDKDMGQESDFEGRKVHTYLKNFVTVKPTRGYKHYSEQQKLDVLQKHHLSAAIFFLAILVLLLTLSWFSEKEYLQIPAGASILLILTMYLMIIGALYSRFKTWTVSITLFLLVGWNYISGVPGVEKLNQAFGIDYASASPYSIAHLKRITSDSIMRYDEQQMINILNNWKAKFPKGEKPKLVIVNSSGGGMRSALWSFGVFQKLDMQLEGNFTDHVFMIAGSSGGMMGSAYFRELKLREMKGELFGIGTRSYFDKLGMDMLNPVGFSMAVNDIFLSFKKFNIGNYRYNYDRGRAFEEILRKNTDDVFNKRIQDYEVDERNANVPLMVLAPTVVNEGRRMIISPLGLSFLSRNATAQGRNLSHQIDGIEFKRFFAQQDADHLLFTSALRMSATFPYITPLVSLPSEPKIELIDAGARDNDGFNLTLRFLYIFNDWIAENTSGVVIAMFLADRPPSFEIHESPFKTKFDSWVRPINGVVNSFNNLQEFQSAKELKVSESWRKFDLSIQPFLLFNEKDDISLSWHLTKNEKERIYQKLSGPEIEGQVNDMIELLDCQR